MAMTAKVKSLKIRHIFWLIFCTSMLLSSDIPFDTCRMPFFFQISKSSCIQMACPLDLWVHGLGQYKAFTSLCIPQHQAKVSDCADKGIPGSTAKRLT